MTATATEHGEPGRSPLPRRRPPLPWMVVAAILPLLLLALWAVLFLPRTGSPSGALVGNRAPELNLADLDGNPVRLADLRGRPVIVNFWASWCVPCVDEFPLLVTAAREHAADGLVIVGVLYEDNADAGRNFMERMGADWATAVDPDGTAATSYGIIGPPDSFFIGSDGVIAGRQIGQLSASDLDRQLAEIITKE